MQHRTNQQRAEMAYRALNKFSVLTGVEGEEDETQISDLLSDLMHYADEQGVDFDDCIEVAKRHYDNEVKQEL